MPTPRDRLILPQGALRQGPGSVSCLIPRFQVAAVPFSKTTVVFAWLAMCIGHWTLDFSALGIKKQIMAMEFNTIVVSIESPELARELYEAARLISEGGRIHALLTTTDHDEEALDTTLEALRRAAAGAIQNSAQVSLHARIGQRAEETLRLAVEANADLLVLGAFMPESARVVARVMFWAACSVLVLAPNKERSEAEGFVPLFPQCTECSKVRSRGTQQWYCKMHEDTTKHKFESVL